MPPLSPLRSRLAGFENAYSLAIRKRETTGHNQFVIRTGDPIQPFRVTATLPVADEDVVLRVA